MPSTANKREKKRVQAVVDEICDGPKESALDINVKGTWRKRVSIPVGGTQWPKEIFSAKERKYGQIRISRANRRLYEMAELNDGQEMSMEELVESMSPEELVRGRPKNEDGTFRGRPPKWIPRAFHQACINELMKRGKRLWQENYLQAIEAMTQIAAGQGPIGMIATPGERIKAAQFVIERLEGKVPTVVAIATDQPWQLLLDDIVAEVSDEQVARGQKALNSATALRQELHDDNIVDAELVEDELDAGVSDEDAFAQRIPPTPRTRPKFHRRRRP